MSTRHPRGVNRLLLTGLAALLPALAWAQQDPLPEGQFDLQFSVEQSRGRYREATPTHISTSVVTGRYRRGIWLAELQLPWVRVRNSGSGAGLPDAPRVGRSVERGRGDALVKLGVELREMSDQHSGLDLVAKLKTRSGSVERGLGTGGTDVSLQLEGMQQLGRWLAFGHLGRRWTGDVPGFAAYGNPWYAEAGLSHPLGGNTEVGAFIDVREPLGRLGALGEATAYAAWRHGAHRLQAYVSRGYRPASADWAAGMSVRTRF